MSLPRDQHSGARTRAFRGPRPLPKEDTGVRYTARAQQLSVDDYPGVPKIRQGVYRSPGRGVSGESSN